MGPQKGTYSPQTTQGLPLDVCCRQLWLNFGYLGILSMRGFGDAGAATSGIASATFPPYYDEFKVNASFLFKQVANTEWH